MEEIKTSVLVVSQLFFTVFGSLVNIFLFIIFRDLPDLSSSTYNVLILNLSFCNIIRCTIIKPMASIFVSYAYTQNESEVAIEFCSVYSLLHWATFPICPLTLFFLSWHLLLSSRRSEDRALRVPKHATSIFLMMLPLATAWFDDLEPVQELKNAEFGKLTSEQKRKNLKAIPMREGPRPRQTVVLVAMWLVAAVVSFVKVFVASAGHVKKEIRREYFVQVIQRRDDISTCTVWSQQEGLTRDLVVWAGLGVAPLVCGPLATLLLELLATAAKKCSRAPHPDTETSLAKYWALVAAATAATLPSLGLHMWVAENWVREALGLDYFSSLLLKYFVGSSDIFTVPCLVLLLDPVMRGGLSYVCHLRKVNGPTDV